MDSEIRAELRRGELEGWRPEAMIEGLEEQELPLEKGKLARLRGRRAAGAGRSQEEKQAAKTAAWRKHQAKTTKVPQCTSRSGVVRWLHDFDKDGVCFWCDTHKCTRKEQAGLPASNSSSGGRAR